MSAAPDGAADRAVGAARVRVRDWGWRHAGRDAWAARGLSLEIDPGERVLLLGASGSGKSTLMRGLAGVLGGDEDGDAEGELTIDGVPAARARGRAGLVLQDPDAQVVLSRVGDDVAFGCENLGVERGEIWRRVPDALAAVGLDVALDRSTSALSGGQKQRLALAGALAMRPGLLLLDEPTAQLDPAGVLEVRDAVLGAVAATGATLVIVEHRLDAWVAHMDRVIVLGERGLIADGAPDEVFRRFARELSEAGVWVPSGYAAGRVESEGHGSGDRAGRSAGHESPGEGGSGDRADRSAGHRVPRGDGAPRTCDLSGTESVPERSQNPTPKLRNSDPAARPALRGLSDAGRRGDEHVGDRRSGSVEHESPGEGRDGDRAGRSAGHRIPRGGGAPRTCASSGTESVPEEAQNPTPKLRNSDLAARPALRSLSDTGRGDGEEMGDESRRDEGGAGGRADEPVGDRRSGSAGFGVPCGSEEEDRSTSSAVRGDGRGRGDGLRPGAGDPLLVGDDLAVGRGGTGVASGISLSVRAGRAIAVVGPNGVGKSTLAMTIAGLLAPVAGEVVAGDALVDGLPARTRWWRRERDASLPREWSSRELLTRIGAVFQSPDHQLMAPTVRAELEIGPRALGLAPDDIWGRVDPLLDRLRLRHLADANPFTLSGGEKRRLTVAAALATRPRVLVLDEPTFGQDARTWRELVDMLAALRDQGTALVLVTHDEPLVDALADDVLRLAPEGAPAALATAPSGAAPHSPGGGAG